jgi:hypothetical protein
VLCLQLVLAVRAPEAVMTSSVPDVAAEAVTSAMDSGHHHHHHVAPPAAADDAPAPAPDSHDGHESGGCHGGLPCCAATLPSARVRAVCAPPQVIRISAPWAAQSAPAPRRIALRQPPATAPPVLG